MSFAIVFFTHSYAFSESATKKEDIIMLMKLIEETRDGLNKRIDETRDSLNKRIDDTNKRIDDLRMDIDNLRETMFWLFGTFISINIIILGFILRMQWQMHRRLQVVESAFETQRDEMNFLKGLVEKLVVGRQ